MHDRDNRERVVCHRVSSLQTEPFLFTRETTLRNKRQRTYSQVALSVVFVVQMRANEQQGNRHADAVAFSMPTLPARLPQPLRHPPLIYRSDGQ